MSGRYVNYLGAKKCCATNLAKTVIGPQGPQGTAGPIGPFGFQGATGARGFQGGPCCKGVAIPVPQSAVSLAGSVQGSTGTQGAQGDAGTKGATGLQGSTGAQGATGSKGSTGAQGDAGTKGSTGAQGSTGSGSQGSTGAQGDAGTKGLIGAQGDAGAKGLTGSQGATGPGLQGATGATGAKGATGNQGATGSQGATGPVGPSSNGLFLFDDFMNIGFGGGGSQLGMRAGGGQGNTQLTSEFIEGNHTGVVRGENNMIGFSTLSTFGGNSTNATKINVENIRIGGQGLTYIFRPFSNGVIEHTIAIVGIHNKFDLSKINTTPPTEPSPTVGVYWKYIHGSKCWILYNNALEQSSIKTKTSTQNKWCKISILRTDTNTFSSTFTIVDNTNAVIEEITGPAYVININGVFGGYNSSNDTYIGWIWGNTVNTSTRTMDIDYVSAEFNSYR